MKQLALILALLFGHLPADASRASAPECPAADAAEERLAEAFRERTSDLWICGRGVVDRLLPDDNRGSRHQRFILRLSSGQTLLVAHNIDLAPRVDSLEVGDLVRFSGEYEWNHRGGVIHWTHHDPADNRPGGWLWHHGRIYR